MAHANLTSAQITHRRNVMEKRGVVHDYDTQTIHVPPAALGNKLLGIVDHDISKNGWTVRWNHVPEKKARFNAAMVAREIEKVARKSARKGVPVTQDQIMLGR